MSYATVDARNFQKLADTTYNAARRLVEGAPCIEDFGANLRIESLPGTGKSTCAQYLAAMAAARGVQVHLLHASSEVQHPLLVQVLADDAGTVRLRRHLHADTLWPDVADIAPGTSRQRVMVVLDNAERFCPSRHLSVAAEHWGELLDDPHTCVVVVGSGRDDSLSVLSGHARRLQPHGDGTVVDDKGQSTTVPRPRVRDVDAMARRWSQKALEAMLRASNTTVVRSDDQHATVESLRDMLDAHTLPRHGVDVVLDAMDEQVLTSTGLRELVHRGRGEVRIWVDGVRLTRSMVPQPASMRFASLMS